MLLAFTAAQQKRARSVGQGGCPLCFTLGSVRLQHLCGAGAGSCVGTEAVQEDGDRQREVRWQQRFTLMFCSYILRRAVLSQVDLFQPEPGLQAVPFRFSLQKQALLNSQTLPLAVLHFRISSVWLLIASTELLNDISFGGAFRNKLASSLLARNRKTYFSGACLEPCVPARSRGRHLFHSISSNTPIEEKLMAGSCAYKKAKNILYKNTLTEAKCSCCRNTELTWVHLQRGSEGK